MHQALQDMARHFDALQSGQMSIAAFSTHARQEQALLQALPDKFTVVLLGLLDRLESSALFAEESCSFSQKDLYDSLQLWLDKAQAWLAARSPAS